MLKARIWTKNLEIIQKTNEKLNKNDQKGKKVKNSKLAVTQGNKFQKPSVINAKTLAIDESRSAIEFFFNFNTKKRYYFHLL